MGARLLKLEEHKGEIIKGKVEELFNKANTDIEFFSSPAKDNEVEEVGKCLRKQDWS